MRALFASSCLVVLAACGGGSAASPGGVAPPAQGSVLSGPPSDTCAGDPWLSQILGKRPALSNSMRVEPLKQTRLYGSYFINRDRPEMDHMGEFGAVPSKSAEVYEWEGPPNPHSSSGHDTARVVVARNVFGDPRAFKSSEGEPLYLAPTTLANGTLEYPPAPANVNATFGPSGGQTIFTFADGTWVRVDGWMVQQFRAAFSTAGAPPLPPSSPDVAWEVCALFDAHAAVATGSWGVVPERGALRFLAGGGPDVEMVYRFTTQDLAERAKAEQAYRCTQTPYTKSNDKGLFDLVPPCKGQVSATVEGPMLRYVYRF